MDEIRCIVAGSRKSHDFDVMQARLDQIFKLAFEKKTPITIVSGTASGADQLSERYAGLRGLAFFRMPAKRDRYGRSAGAGIRFH